MRTMHKSATYQHAKLMLPRNPLAWVPDKLMVSQLVVYSEALCSTVVALCPWRSEQVIREMVSEPGPQNFTAVTDASWMSVHCPSTMDTSPNNAVPAASVLEVIDTVVCCPHTKPLWDLSKLPDTPATTAARMVQRGMATVLSILQCVEWCLHALRR